MKITITATANGSLQPSTGTFPNKVQNGDFSISGNSIATFVGDGVDEETSWAFDFNPDPNYQFFDPSQGLASAMLTLTLTPRNALITTDSVRIAGLSPITGPIPALPVNVTNTVQIDLLAQGYTAAAILGVFAINTGKIPMLYQDDSIVSSAKLELAQNPPALQYAVKFVCGKSDGKVVAPGSYFTAINVHNPAYETVKFRKKFAVALPSEKAGPVTPFFRTGLGPDQAFEIDNEDIFKHIAESARAITLYKYNPRLRTLPGPVFPGDVRPHQGWEFLNDYPDWATLPDASRGSLHQYTKLPVDPDTDNPAAGRQWFSKAPTASFRFSEPGTFTLDFSLVLKISTHCHHNRAGWAIWVTDPDTYLFHLDLGITSEGEVIARLDPQDDSGDDPGVPWISTGVSRDTVGDYRVTVEGRHARFYVSGIERGSQELRTPTPLHYPNSMFFGDPTDVEWSESELLGLTATYTPAPVPTNTDALVSKSEADAAPNCPGAQKLHRAIAGVGKGAMP